MSTVKLTQGQVAMIDDCDADLVGMGWFAIHGGRTFYAVRHGPTVNGRRAFIQMHRVIAERMGIPGNPDHANRNGVDNRRSNLRAATRQQNNANKSHYRNNTSGYRGVCPYWNRWRALLKANGKQRCIGSFSSPVSAALAYDRAARGAFGEFASVNFSFDRATDALIRASFEKGTG